MVVQLRQKYNFQPDTQYFTTMFQVLQWEEKLIIFRHIKQKVLPGMCVPTLC